MAEYRSLSHTKWDCKYHLVFIPKRRKKVIYGQIRRMLGDLFHELAGHKDVEIVEGHLRPDHVHMCLRIAPKYAVSNVVGYLKGKSAIMIARFFGSCKFSCDGEGWQRGARALTSSNPLILLSDVRFTGPLHSSDHRKIYRRIFCWKGAEFHGREFLGQRLLCVDGWIR